MGLALRGPMVRAFTYSVALLFTGAALAEEWKQYENRYYAFTVNFPGTPTVENSVYQAADGRNFPAHVFAVKQKDGEFKVTVVDMQGEKTGSDDAFMNEASRIAAVGRTIKFNAVHRIRAGIGRQLGIVGASGGISCVALFYRSDHLYQIEGNAFVAGGQAEAEAMRFEQSFDLI
jgi:hypothetical protein